VLDEPLTDETYIWQYGVDADGRAELQTLFLKGDRKEGRGASPSLGLAISALGTPDFGRGLFAALQADLACDQVSVFAFSAQALPRIVAAGDLSDDQVSRVLARKYVSGYWKSDPAFTFLSGLEQVPDLALVSISSLDISDRDYRAHFYEHNGITSRLTMARRDATGLWVSNFYRNAAQPPFSGDDLASLSRQGPLIDSLTRKHDQLLRDRPDFTDLHSIEERMSAPPFDLSPRERHVCARILHGLTSEGIALDLGISTNSVLTHRKSAYRRLNISSQNELYRLFLQGSPQLAG
jgi:LuxR family transcriptional regulator, activator of tox operons